MMVISEKRPKLEKQALSSLKNNTEYPHVLFSYICDKHPNDIELRNDLANSIWAPHDYICFVDDDLYFNEGWLDKMVNVLEKERDITIVSAIKWPGHKVLEKRKDISITDRMTGGCLLMRRLGWQMFGPFDIHRDKTNLLRERIQKAGGKVAVLNDELAVVHCGVKSIINDKGRSKETEERIRKLAAKVGAICE